MKKKSFLAKKFTFIYGFFFLLFFSFFPSIVFSKPFPLKLRFVLSQALQHSSRWEMLRAQNALSQSTRLQIQSPFQSSLSSQSSYLKDQNQTSSPFEPQKEIFNFLDLNWNTVLPYGLSIHLEESLSKTKLIFDPSIGVSNINYFESALSVSLTQSLYPNFFGREDQKTLQMAKKTAQAQAHELDTQKETWALGLIRLYEKARFLKTQLQSWKDQKKRQKKLLFITRRKLEQGTAELQDALQVKKALSQTQTAFFQTQKELYDIWRQLVLELKFPKTWLHLSLNALLLEPDPYGISLLETCQNTSIPPMPSTQTQAAQKTFQSARLEKAIAQSKTQPSFKLVFSAKTNSIENQNFLKTVSEHTTLKHPEWTLGVLFQYPLSNPALQAKKIQKTVQLELKSAAFSASQTQDQVFWINTCAHLRLFKNELKKWTVTAKEQIKRLALEQKRFQLGRTSALSVILSGADLTESQIQKNSFSMQFQLEKWALLARIGKLKTFLTHLQTSPLLFPSKKEFFP